jgi:hypothetical protein
MDPKAFMGAHGEPRLPGGKPAVSRRGSFWSRLFSGRSKPKVPLEEETPYAEQSVVGRAKQQMQVKRSRSLLTQLAENSGMGRRQDPAPELVLTNMFFSRRFWSIIVVSIALSPIAFRPGLRHGCMCCALADLCC